MQDQQNPLHAHELEAERELETYKLGKTLLAQHGRLDPHDPFALEALSEALPPSHLQAYILAFEHDEQQEVQRRLRHKLIEQRHVAAPVAHRDPGKLDGPLTDAVRRFLDQKAPAVRPKTLQAYAAKCQLFCAVLAEANNGRAPLVSEITAERVQDYADIIRKLPKNFSLSSGQPVRRALRGSYAPIDAKTRSFHFATIRDFLRWAEQQHYAVRPNLGSIFGSLKTKSTRKRVPFHRDDLERIFHSQQYTRGTFKRSSEYWVPLLGLFTGAREAELCQLHVADVYQDEATAIWVIDINQRDDKKLKSGEQNERKIPLHPQLARLGFLKFVAQMKDRGNVRLFPDEERNAHGEFAAFSKRFNRYRESLGVVSDGRTRKDFHSFRHNVSTFLVDHACPDYVINAITGHSQADQSLAVKLYAKTGVGLKQTAEWLAKLDYGLDWSVVRANGWRKRIVLKDPPSGR
jgi:integrase